MEFTTFLRFMGKVKKMPLGDWQHYSWQHNGDSVILLETGIGPKTAGEALTTLLQVYRIDCIINFGSAGMIDESLKVGDAVLVDEIIDLTSGQIISTNDNITDAISQFLNEQKKKYIRGRLATSPEPVSKRAHRKKLEEKFGCYAVDMEAYALARVAIKHNIPFSAIKMISDRASSLTRLEYWKNISQIDKQLGKIIHGFLDYLKAA